MELDLPKGKDKEAAPQESDDSLGGSGGPCVRAKGRADTALLERAVREQWPIPDQYREAIVNRQVGIAIDPENSARESTSAARCIASMNKQNMEAARQATEKLQREGELPVVATEQPQVIIYVPHNGRGPLPGEVDDVVEANGYQETNGAVT